MRKLLYINMIVALLVCGSASPASKIVSHRSVSNMAQCSCQVATVDLAVAGNYNNVIDSFPVTVSNPNSSTCNYACANASASHYHDQTIATKACQANAPIGGAPNGTVIRSYSLASGGQQNYQQAFVIGQLIRAYAVPNYVWKCPAGWLANTTNQPGGVSADKKCKKPDGPLLQAPLPDNGTQLGTWGFSWGDHMWAWGTAANGGASTYVNIGTPAVCKF